MKKNQFPTLSGGETCRNQKPLNSLGFERRISFIGLNRIRGLSNKSCTYRVLLSYIMSLRRRDYSIFFSNTLRSTKNDYVTVDKCAADRWFEARSLGLGFIIFFFFLRV